MIILAQKGSKIYPNTNLPITLWLKLDNQKIIYMQNNYNKYTTGNDLVPISIDKNNPKLLEDVELNVKKRDLKKVLNFIKEKYQILIDTIKGVDIDYSIMEHTYINKFKPTVIDGFFVNGISPKDYPSLPVDLYLYCDNVDYDDERDLYTLLMCNKVGYKGGFENYVTVSIDKENPRLVYDVELGITKEEFKRVQDFIKRHYDFLVEYTKSNEMDIVDIANIGSQEETFNYNWVLNELNKDYDIDGMARIGFTNDGYEVLIITDDYKLSDVPHFHYRKKEKNKKMEFHTCIRFDKAEYYHHIGDEDVLNNEQIKNLIEFLSSKHKSNKRFRDNWEYALSSWNDQNDYKFEINEDLKIPNYMNLK